MMQPFRRFGQPVKREGCDALHRPASRGDQPRDRAYSLYVAVQPLMNVVGHGTQAVDADFAHVHVGHARQRMRHDPVDGVLIAHFVRHGAECVPQVAEARALDANALRLAKPGELTMNRVDALDTRHVAPILDDALESFDNPRFAGGRYEQ
jgi:hypothetical protein